MASAAQVEVLKAHYKTCSQQLRPVLTFLNGDNSWLMSFPRPAQDREATRKFYYHVVYEPWLVGPAIVYVSLLLHMEKPTDAIYRTADDIEQLVREIEQTASECIGFHGEAGDGGEEKASPIDAIWIGASVADHLHEKTLRLFNPTIPIFATPDAASTMQGWRHFRTIVDTSDLSPTRGPSWRDLHPGAPLPTWLHIFRLPSTMVQGASVIVWSRGGGADGVVHEAIVTSPHGIKVQEPVVSTYVDRLEPAVKTTALLHALKESFSFGMPTTLGAAGGLALQRALQARYWVNSADSVLRYWGFLSLFTRDVFRTLDWALEEEETKRRNEGQPTPLPRPQFVDMEMGSSLILE